MRQHYLPQKAHLANFTDPDTPQGQEAYLWLCDPETQEWRKRAPKNVAWERDFYVVTDEEGNESNAVEVALGGVESEATRIICRLIVEERPFGDGDRWSLALFVALMHTRMPGHRQQVRRYLDDLADISRQMSEQFGAKDPMAGEKTPEAERDELVRITLSSVEVVARVIDSMEWQIWVSKSPDYLGTSDLPVVLSNPRIPDDSFFRPGLVDEETMLTFPLTRTAILLARHHRRGLHYLPATAAEVENFNRLSWFHGHRIFAAPKPDVPGVEALMSALRRRPMNGGASE